MLPINDLNATSLMNRVIKTLIKIFRYHHKLPSLI